MQYRSDLMFINPLDIRDKNGNIQLSFPDPTASADNYLSVLNGYSGTTGQYKGVGFASEGGGSNIDIYLAPKGDGIARIYSASATSYRELIAGISNAIATVDYVERAVTIGVIYLQHVKAVFDNSGSALTAPVAGSVTIDGNTITTGDRVLVKASNDTYNTWIVECGVDSWTKVEDFLDEDTNDPLQEVHYKVGATTFVDNDGTSPTYKDVRFTWNGTEWVLQYSSSELPYGAEEGVKLTNFTFSMDIPNLTELTIPADDDYLAIYDTSGTIHKKISVLNLLPEPAGTYSWEIGADNSTDNQVSSSHDVHLLGDTDNWVDTVYSYSAGVHTIKFQYGLAGGLNRVLMTNALGNPIEANGGKGFILRPAYNTPWDSGTIGEFIQSTKLPLGGSGSAGALVLYTPEATGHYVTLQAPATATDQTYLLPQAYPTEDLYVLAATTTGTMSWVARTTNTDKLVAADTGGTAGYLTNVLQGTTDGTPISGIKVSTYNTNYTLIQQTISDTGVTRDAVATDLLAVYDTTGDKLINGNVTASQLSSIYLLSNYVSTNVFYNGSIAVYELGQSDFTLVNTEYVASDTIDSIIGSTDYDSDWVLAIVQRKYTDGSTTKYETIQCNTRVYRDDGNGDKGTVDIAFTNQPGAGEVFRVTLILDPTLLTQPS
jgi:hypothetical protein